MRVCEQEDACGEEGWRAGQTLPDDPRPPRSADETAGEGTSGRAGSGPQTGADLSHTPDVICDVAHKLCQDGGI